MNIKITYNWLLEYLETDADPYELQKYLSLCGPSVEHVEEVVDDYILDIEVTSNRIDMASVFGIAQEAQAILPQFGKKAKLKKNPFKELKFGENGENILPLTVKVSDEKLASRVTAVVLSGAVIKPSPDLIRKRLEWCGIRSINNVVDVTNYVMLELGQPAHVFDYNSIKDHLLKIRESKKGEKVITLDKKEIELPGGDIVIEDGSGSIIDLCGIMGGFSSMVTNETKNIVLFIQTYNKRLIRKTSMTTGQRSVAASYFEKGLDEERVEPATVLGIELLKKNAGVTVGSAVTDIFPHPYKPVTVSVTNDFIVKRIGVDIPEKTSQSILENLGFEVKYEDCTFSVKVQSTRKYDVAISEDIVEEIARIYGYHNLPNNLSPMVYLKQPKEIENLYTIQRRIKYVLKHAGLSESMNYSMISEKMIRTMNLKTEHHLEIGNTISEELKYMRISLLPSLVKNIAENEGKRDVLKFFEIAKVYYPQPGDLPKEVYKLGIAVNTSFEDLKGIIELLLNELKITEYSLKKGAIHLFVKNRQLDYTVNGSTIGSGGRLGSEIQFAFSIKKPVYLAGFDLISLAANARIVAPYKPVNAYAAIKLDLSAKITAYADFVKNAHRASALLQSVEFIEKYKDTVTVRLNFSSAFSNLTDTEAAKELEKIKAIV